MATKKRRKKNKGTLKWDNSMYIQVFQLAQSGLSHEKIAESIGYSLMQFRRRKKKDPALQDALKKGQSAEKPTLQKFENYVYSRLTPELKWLWDEIASYQKETNAIAKIEKLLKDKGIRAKQHLFLHALYKFHFKYEKACKFLDVSKRELERWMNDSDFAELLSEIEWHTSQYFGNLAMDMAREGHPAMVKFCAQTLDPRFKRRPSEKNINVNVRGRIGHAHVGLGNEFVSKLDKDQKRLLLETIKENRKANGEDIEDAEVV